MEVLTSAGSKGPNRDWLKLVKTSEAKNKIRQWFKKEKRAENIQIAKTELDRELRSLNRAITDEQKEEILLKVAERHGMTNLEDLYNFIGYGGITVGKILPRIKHELDKLAAEKKPPEQPFANLPQQAERPAPLKHGGSGVIVQGIDSCQVKFAKCCNPLPGDPIIGFITKGFGISIHKYDCKNALHGLSDPTEKDRWINASWTERAEDNVARYDAGLNIHAHNSLGLLAQVSSALADMHIETLSIQAKGSDDGLASFHLVIRTKNKAHYESVVSRLMQIPDIIRITRGTN